MMRLETWDTYIDFVSGVSNRCIRHKNTPQNSRFWRDFCGFVTDVTDVTDDATWDTWDNRVLSQMSLMSQIASNVTEKPAKIPDFGGIFTDLWRMWRMWRVCDGCDGCDGCGVAIRHKRPLKNSRFCWDFCEFVTDVTDEAIWDTWDKVYIVSQVIASFTKNPKLVDISH